MKPLPLCSQHFYFLDVCGKPLIYLILRHTEQICKGNNLKVNKIFSHFDNRIRVMCTNQKTYNIKNSLINLYLLNLEKN